MNTYLKIFVIACATCLVACTAKEQQAEALHKSACIVPDYMEVTMPCNIAPPTFALADDFMLDEAQAVFEAGDVKCVVKSRGDDGFCIDIDDWRQLTNESGNKVMIRIQGKKEGKWVEYDAFPIFISPDSIDSHLAYRLIEPGYEQWKEMGIYQRCLDNYDEEAIITNRQTDGGCMNCHSFAGGDAKNMSFHLRADYAGTYIVRDGRMEKHTPNPALVYPYWHPSKKYIAYSTNETKQMFHTTDLNRIEVFDYASDIVVYEIGRREPLTCDNLHSTASFETFPAFSPDGKTLYFCSADSVRMPEEYDKAHYSLCSISFDASTGTFGDVVDTLYNAKKERCSVSFPRVSPDGRYLVFTRHNYGNFSIWHHEADLWMIDLKDNSIQPMHDINSSDTESYHSWSKNGRWMVFSSRRDDGLYTRPYITHIDASGKATKPFALPQSDASYYGRLMKSFNVPELVTGKVERMSVK